MRSGTDEEAQSRWEIEFSLGDTEFELPVGSAVWCLGSCCINASLKVRCDPSCMDRCWGAVWRAEAIIKRSPRDTWRRRREEG